MWDIKFLYHICVFQLKLSDPDKDYASVTSLVLGILTSNIPFQRNCVEFALKAKPVRRYIPKHKFQYKIWWFVTSQPFEYTIFTLIVLNTITLAMKYDEMSDDYIQFLDSMNLFFTGAFALEFLFKLAAYRFKVYNSSISHN